MPAISATKRIRLQPRQIARSAGSREGQAHGRAAGSPAHGFLSQFFLPLYEPGKAGQDTEQEYFASLQIVQELQGTQAIDISGKPFPYNVLLSHWDTERQLNRQPIPTDLLIVRDGQDKVKLATRQEFSPGHTLYYIPVMPLFRLLRDKQRKACAELLLSVIGYLYHEARIPYYRDEQSYLYYHYECNKEWLMECKADYDLAEYEENMSDVWRNEYCGDVIERKVYHRYQLEHFRNRLDRFKPKDALERDCLRVANDAWDLWQAFPGHTVFQHVPDIHPDDEDDIASFEPYVSFVGDCEGWLYDNVEGAVSDTLNEYMDAALPGRVEVFDDPAAGRATGLEFEYQLFELILNLATILLNMPCKN